MTPKYYVVLFKNKVRKKIIKKFSNFKNSETFYNNLIKESSEVIFPKKIENGKDSHYELALLQNKTNQHNDIYMTDELGRNVRVVLEDESFEMVKIKPYEVEELIYDTQKKQKISTPELIKSYLKGDGVKMVSTLNNKFIIQKDEDIKLFSLKSELETERFIDCISKQFYKEGRKDCLFVKDTSTAQKKYLFSVLSEMGIDKKVLYRKFTTYPRQ